MVPARPVQTMPELFDRCRKVRRPKAQWKEAEEQVVLGERGAIRRFDDDSRPGYMMIFVRNNIVTVII